MNDMRPLVQYQLALRYVILSIDEGARQVEIVTYPALDCRYSLSFEKFWLDLEVASGEIADPLVLAQLPHVRWLGRGTPCTWIPDGEIQIR